MRGRVWGWRYGVGLEDRDEDVRNIVAALKTLGTEPSVLLTSDMGMEQHHPILSIMGGHIGCIEKENVCDSYKIAILYPSHELQFYP